MAAERSSPADVTVVIPVKDRAQLLDRALRSVAAQTAPPAEVVVVDDGSSDASPEVAKRNGATLVRLGVSGGSGLARNAGIERARTGWVAFLDSDDTWEPAHLSTLMARAVPPLVLLTTTARASTGELVGNVGGTEVPLDPARCFAPSTIVATSGTVVRTDALREAGLFRPLARVQDLDLWARVLELGPGLALTAVTVNYTRRSRYTTVEHDRRERENLGRVLEDLADRPWMTPDVRACVLGRTEWDGLRLAQHERRWADVVRHAAWFATRPRSVAQLPAVLQVRREGRARAEAEAPRRGSGQDTAAGRP